MLDNFPPISDEQRRTFEALTSGAYGNFALLSVRLDDQPTAAICAITTDGAECRMQPLYVAVTDPIFDRIQPPPTEERP